MDNITKYLNRIAYKFPKGYPDMNDEQDTLLMKNILKEEFNILLENPELEDFFNPNYIVFTEHNIISPNEINLKPDRLVIHNSEAFLIDYKTGAQDEKHKNQIENYARVIEKMNLKVTKKVVLYIGEELKIIHL